MLRVLVTGMSGTGKSALVAELRRLGHAAYDADDDGYTEPRSDGRWGWRTEAVRQLFQQSRDDVLYFAGCSEEQASFAFDLRVLLWAPEPVIVERLRGRTSNAYGKTDAEMQAVLSDMTIVEPLLRRTADLVVDSTAPVERVAQLVVDAVAGLRDAADT